MPEYHEQMLRLVPLTLFFPAILFAAQARSLPPDVMKARVSEPHFTHEAVELKIPNGPNLSAKILVPGPRKLSELDQKMPALLVFGGLEDAGKMLELLDPKLPVIVSSFNYPFESPRRFDFPESLRDAPDAKLAIRRTIDGIIELTSVLKKRSDVDSSRITVVGASFGAVFALAAAAEDSDITGIVLIDGFGKIPLAIRDMLTRRWSPNLGFMAAPFAWMLAQSGWLYLNPPEPETSVRKLSASQHVLLITAESDTVIPHESTESLWGALKVSRVHRERVDMPGDHLQAGTEAGIAEVEGIVTTWMEHSDLK